MTGCEAGHDWRCNNPGVLGGKGRISAGFPRIVAFLCNNPGGNGCFSGIIVGVAGYDVLWRRADGVKSND